MKTASRRLAGVARGTSGTATYQYGLAAVFAGLMVIMMLTLIGTRRDAQTQAGGPRPQVATNLAR